MNHGLRLRLETVRKQLTGLQALHSDTIDYVPKDKEFPYSHSVSYSHIRGHVRYISGCIEDAIKMCDTLLNELPRKES